MTASLVINRWRGGGGGCRVTVTAARISNSERPIQQEQGVFYFIYIFFFFHFFGAGKLSFCNKINWHSFFFIGYWERYSYIRRNNSSGEAGSHIRPLQEISRSRRRIERIRRGDVTSGWQIDARLLGKLLLTWGRFEGRKTLISGLISFYRPQTLRLGSLVTPCCRTDEIPISFWFTFCSLVLFQHGWGYPLKLYADDTQVYIFWRMRRSFFTVSLKNSNNNLNCYSLGEKSLVYCCNTSFVFFYGAPE